jgi:hypothetical protein
MRLSEFFQQYSDETACKEKFKSIREQEGIICKHCKSQAHYWQGSIWQWQCKQCGFRTTLRSGTVLENSKLPYRYWLSAMAFLTAPKKSISALELQRELGHKRYEPIWAMLHKLRLVMRYRDTRYELKEYLELDEGFFETADRRPDKDDDENQRGRGSHRQMPVLVAVESLPVEKPQNNGKPNRQVKHLKMTVMDNLTSKDIHYEVAKSIDPNATVMTDGYKGYSKLNTLVNQHKVVVVKDKTMVDKIFPWVHKTISNAKRLLLGIHHSIKSTYMQNYLDEYCYKFNRRYFGHQLFDRLLIASVSATWYKNVYSNG